MMTLNTNEKSIKADLITHSQCVFQNVVSALNEGNFFKAASYFNEKFVFTDQALDLQFNDRKRLQEFFQKTSDFFPGTQLQLLNVFGSENYLSGEWHLTATHEEPFLYGRSRTVQISVQGVSVVQFANDKIIRWTDYYDRWKSRRFNVIEWFSDWDGA